MIFKVEKAQLPECLEVMHAAYDVTAKQFGLTADNCPYRGNADLPLDELAAEFDSGAAMFGWRENGYTAGFLSIRVDGDTAKINDLVVLPEHWHKGIGSELINCAKRFARERGVINLTLGMIDDNELLRRWYERHGFVTVRRKKFAGAPFTVGYMEQKLSDE